MSSGNGAEVTSPPAIRLLQPDTEMSQFSPSHACTDTSQRGWCDHCGATTRCTTTSMYEQIAFAGLDSERELPTGYRRLLNRHGVDTDEPEPFTNVLSYLHENFGIEYRDLYYEAETSEPGVQPVNHYTALVNPAWEGLPSSEIPGDRDDAVWHIPTKKYTKATPNDLWRPLVKAIAKHGLHSDVFGSVRARREGGELYIDLFFEQMEVEDAAEGEQITLGISTGHDYYGNVRLFVDAVAYHDSGDGVGQVMRYLTDPKRRKHTGEASDEVVAWYETSVDRLKTVSKMLYNVVAEAMHYEVPIGEMACSIEGFYEHLGLPNTSPSELAAPAGNRAVETAVGPYTGYHLYKAGMWAIEHHYDSRDTSSFKTHVNTVNMLLFNPPLAEKQVLSSIESTLLDRPDDEHEIWDFVDTDHESALEKTRSRATSISEGVEAFESTRDRLQTLLQDEGVVEAEPATDGGASD